MNIRRSIHNAKRLRHIFTVMLKYGFGNVVKRFNLEHNILGRKILSSGRIRKSHLLDMPFPVKVRKVCEELGPTFIKLGQVLSVRPDMVTINVARELEKLQDSAPSFPYEEAAQVIARELGMPLEAVFSGFAREPCASASLSQAHEARLITGEDVIVKVQRPGIDDIIAADTEILQELARLAEKYIEEIRSFNPTGMVLEFRKSITREIDFTREARNIDRFRAMFQNDEKVHIPRVYHEQSRRKVLTLEKAVGVKVSDFEALETGNFDRKEIAKTGANAVLKQIFEFGFFHADPHPGNFLVSENNNLTLLDFGMTGRLSEQMRSSLADILAGVVKKDVPGIREAFLSMGAVKDDIDIGALDEDIEDLVDTFYDKPLREINFGQGMMEMITMVSRHAVRLPPDLFLLSKALLTIEGVGRGLDPDFNMAEQSAPFVESLRRQKYAPKKVADALLSFAAALARFARALPQDLTAIIGKLKQGTLKVEFEHRGLENLTLHIERAANRIAFSLIFAALIVGSSIIILASAGQRIAGLSTLGMAGFIAAGIMGIWLIAVIAGSGRK